MSISRTPARQRGLHVFALSAFAIAQPLYDLIGHNAEFLVAHRAGPWTVAALVGVVSVLVPLVLWSVAIAAGLLSVRLAAWLQTGTIGVLTGLVAAGIARQMPTSAAMAVALIAAIGAGLAYHGARAARTFLTVVSPAALVFPIVFVVATPVSRLVHTPRTGQTGTAGDRRPPIVLVVFDELDTLSLLDANGDIDAARYPNFAALARTATWFPNAVAASPSTTYALPAIVTGVTPDSASRRLPIAADYPSNLFTWLGSSYALHVREPLTSLCAGALCQSPEPVRAAALASDVAVLYLHLITPHELANRRLPSLAFAWKGFTPQAAAPREAPPPKRGPDAEAEFERALQHSVEVRRSDLVRQFVGEIAADRDPALHFLHSMLPHDPYEYLPSGRAYPHGGITTGLTLEAWTQEQPLIDTGRHRHIEQVRFVDTLVGELVDRLKSQGLFDAALLIVTSDHGGSFVPGQPHRGFTVANYRGIVAAAMFVKLPRQTNGATSERRVSGLDIVPTIAEALGAAVPWHVDGHSMFAGRFPDRSTVQYAGLSLPPLETFDVRDEARRAARARAPAAELESLVGRSLARMDVTPPAPGRFVISDNFRTFESVPLESGLLPALVQGVVLPEDSSPLDLAIAVNGVIGAVTRTAHWNGSGHYFSALVPESGFHDGANRLDVLAVDRSGAGVRLSWVPSPLPAKLRIESGPGGERLIGSDGPVAIFQPHIVGWVDRVIEAPDALTLLGWAADTKTARDLRAVVAFSGGTAIGYTVPSGARPDVVAALGLARPTRTGYGLSIRRNDVRPGGVRVCGLNGDGEAGELKLTDGARAVLVK
ncbi:MAG: hypothetical protein A3G21_07370 [Acidobacteria bacterium RIFCSPLOWO2_12_FULL_66_21]|nr:MAG: hypothetical protein A3G21_07370 [Acidobacteria bacterium RIFCSPLOWO2_12_FULL_66_21]